MKWEETNNVMYIAKRLLLLDLCAGKQTKLKNKNKQTKQGALEVTADLNKDYLHSLGDDGRIDLHRLSP